jgi:CDP-diglyceride synthetase
MDDDQRDREDEQPTAPRSGQVRIVGAEPAGRGSTAGDTDLIGGGPGAGAGIGLGSGTQGAVPGRDPFDAPLPAGTNFDLSAPFGSEVSSAMEGFSPSLGDDLSVGTELPHWTEPPTGEVPAVLARDMGEQPEGGLDPWSSLPAPTWREEHADWTAHEETFEPSMLAQGDARLGSLDDSGATDRQPWSFDLSTSDEPPPVLGEGPAGLDDDSGRDTAVVPAVRLSGAPQGSDDVAFRFEEPEEPRAVPLVRPMARGAEATAISDVRGSEAGESRAADDELPVAQRPTVPHVTIPDEDDLASPVVPVDPEEVGEPRARRTGRGPRRPGRRRSRSEPEVRLLTQAPMAELEGEDEGEEGTTADAVANRPIPKAGSTTGSAPPPEDRPVPEAPASRAGRPVPPTGRPVPPAPRQPPRARSGAGLRPPRVPEPQSETHGGGRNLPLAVVSGLVLGIIALVFFDLGTVTAMIVATVVVTLAAVEAYAAFRKGGYHPATLLGLVATASLMVATYNKGQEALPLVLVLLVAFTLLWHLVGVERVAEPIRSIASTLFVFCWVGVFGSFAALLLNPTLFPNRHGIAFLLGAVITAVAYDVGALAVGGWIGSHPLSEVSPNKTWEGFFGGAVAAVLVAVVVVHFIHPWTLGAAAMLGVVVAVVSPIGDLSESLVKRHIGLKDMGRILPGHGGLLDRVDGLLFVLPATYYLVKAFHLG